MFPYWLLFGFIAIGAAIKRPVDDRVVRYDPLLLTAFVIVALMIGLRFHVGGDWWTYTRYYSFASLATFDQIIKLDDPGYQVLNWFVAQAGAGVWLVNLVCGVIFSWGLFRLVRLQPYPWLSLLIAVPYLIIVVAMGYSRQGVAIGVLMAGTASLQRNNSIMRYAIYVAVAAVFHRTAVIGLPLLLVGGQRSWVINMLIGLGGTILLYDILLADSIDRFVDNYVTAEMTSQGALIRLAMCLVPAILFIRYRRRLGFEPAEEHIWRNMSYATMALAAAFALALGSTVIDRLALYLLPLQLAVLPRMVGPLVAARFGKLLIIFYCFAIQFVWLNFATNSGYWLPYQVYSFDGST